MATQIPWVERVFEFNYPAGLYPGIVERVRGTPARVEERVRGLAPGLARQRADEGWTIQENVGHLLNIEPLWAGRCDDFEAGAETLRPADMTNRATHEARYNDQPLEQILSGFRDERMKMIARLERLEPEGFARTALHPRLNTPMRLVDMLYFIAEHDDYHLARITELIHRFGRE